MKLKDLLMPKYEVHIVQNEKEGYIKVKGSVPALLTALSHFIKNLKESGVKEEYIDYAVNQAKMSDEEIKKSILDKIDKLSEKLKKDLF